MRQPRGAKITVGPGDYSVAGGAAKVQHAPWRRYPNLDAAVEMGNAPVLAGLERTRRELDRLSRTGTAREKERARAALLAYDRALELYSRLAKLRDEALRAAPSNMRDGSAITQ